MGKKTINRQTSNSNASNNSIGSGNTNTSSNNGSRGFVTNIPDVIDPGITIPIYEEDIDSMDAQSPQKIGSYRARAGKFSNTLSNLLPSISAKLHHSKKSGSKNEDTPTSSNSNSATNLPSIILENNKELPMDHMRPGHLTPPNEIIQFPESSNHMLGIPRGSSDSYTFSSSNQLNPVNTNNTNANNNISRTRHNTMTSQITSMSSITQGQTIWSNNINPDMHMMHPLHTSMTSNTVPSNMGANPNYYDPNVPTTATNNIIPNDNNVVNNLSLQPPNPNNLWVNNSNANRQRSLSNASSIYMDAPLYGDQNQNRNKVSSMNYNPNMNASQITANESIQKSQIGNTSPFVGDDVDPRSLNWVSTDPSVLPINQITNLLPTNTISISNVFPLQQQQPQLSNTINLTSTSLATLCSKFGEVLSSRTFKNINMALVEFDNVEGATRAMTALQGKEVSVVGAPSKVCYAKILPMHHSSQSIGSTDQLGINSRENIAPQSLLQEQLYNGSVTFQQKGNVAVPVFNQYYSQQQQQQQQGHQQSQPASNQQGYTSHTYTSHNSIEKEVCPFTLPPPTLVEEKETLKDIVKSFDIKTDDKQIHSLLQSSFNFHGTSDTTNFGPLPTPLTNKEFDAPKLRELRKAIDNDSLSDLELEQLAICMVDELPELSSDYLGNTIVQKLFEVSSDIVKDIMLRKTSTYLASMGVHKNGTWACQKMITMATTPRQIMFVIKGIYNYCVPLFTDQFGNYVIQCVLKCGYPWNSIIFESITANFWIIVQNRYGSRAVRACLEAHDMITTEQTVVLSSMIVVYAKYLATNNNSTLLLTWFLDTCVLPKRYSIVVPRLLPSIVELCCHRLASLTVLKILNYRGDLSARSKTLEAIFGDFSSDKTPAALKQILTDTNNGPTFIYKVLSMSLLEEDIKGHIIKQVRKLVVDIPTAQQHRRLMEEIGFQTSQTVVSNGQLKHKKSSSHIYNTESGNHMRGVSMSSVRSGGSRHNTLMTNVTSNPLPVQQLQTMNSNNGGASSATNYYNYPGGFPPNNYNNNTYGNNATTDDIASQLDSLYLGNGTQVSLPQLSVTNQSNTANIMHRKSSSNQYTDNVGYNNQNIS
ncbi:mRNA-binding protein Puf2p [Monosporozyma unispora]